MSAVAPQTVAAGTQQYAECIAASRRIRWDIDLDVLRGRGSGG